MSWIAEYDTHGREFPTCVHVTKTTGGMTHGATYVPIQVGKDVRAENAKLRDENSRLQKYASKAWLAFPYCDGCPYADCGCDTETVPMHEGCKAFEELRELGIEVDDGTE